MKRIFIIATLLAAFTFTAAAQTGAFQEAVSDYYRVFSEVSLTHAQETAERLDAYLELFNRHLHFDLSTLETKLKVRVFSNKTNFDSYLSSLVPQKRDSFVFLQYRDLAKSELLGFFMENESFNKALVHHGFIQFLKAYIPNPPLWLQKGFAVYLEKSVYDAANQTAIYRENLAWVRTLKNLISQDDASRLLDLSSLLSTDVDGANDKIEGFYAEAWGLVSFLANSSIKEYNRILWDSISALSPEATMEENGRAIATQVFRWIPADQALADFQAYLGSVKTFPELVREGMGFYSDGKLESAEKSFLRAIERNEMHNIPYYYLGLINYSRNEHSLAEYYYLTSQQMGGDLGLTFYALGVNAFADNRLNDAKSYLGKASDADPFGYSEKSDALLQKIE